MADQEILTSVREGGAVEHVTKLFRDLGGGVYAEVVAIGAANGDVVLTGDIVVDTLGALNNAAVVDPAAASATIPALMRGELTELLALVARVGEVQASPTANTLLDRLKTLATAIGAAGDSVGANTVIGQLKQIAQNTTP